MPKSSFDPSKPQGYPNASRLLRTHHISLRQIAMAAGIQHPTVRRALRGGRTQPATRKIVQLTVERLLSASAAQFDPKTLWKPSKIKREDAA